MVDSGTAASAIFVPEVIQAPLYRRRLLWSLPGPRATVQRARVAARSRYSFERAQNLAESGTITGKIVLLPTRD